MTADPAPDEPVLLREATAWGVRLVLNRPAKLNAISAELRDELAAAIAEAAADERVRVIAIAGAGRAFCAGYDLSEAAPPTAWDWRDVLGRDVAAKLAIWSCPKPVIAQVHGYALAGGLELAMACDLIVAADDAQLGEPEIRFGSAPVTLLMPFLIGQKKTRELLLTGDLIGAAEAERIGLVHRVVPAADLAAAVLLDVTLPDGAIHRGLLVSRQIAGIELILGGRRDPTFGPIVVAGLGGVLAEVLDDVAIRLAPVDPATAAGMLDGLRGAAILDGARGRPGIDRAAVAAAIVALGDLLAGDPDVLEIDCNPVISGPDATAAVDALVVVGEGR
jgi:enoyl-CoA hydratase/carnithine racemase